MVPDAAYVPFEEAYSAEEQAVVLEQVALALAEKDTSELWAVVTRTTYREGLNALSAEGDVWIAEADDTPALAVRIGGPLSPFEQHCSPSAVARGQGEWAATVSSHSLFGLDGTSFMGGVQLLPLDGELPVVPPIDADVESDPAHIPLDDLESHLPPEPTLSPEGQVLNDGIRETLQQLFPSRFALTLEPAMGDAWQSVGFTADDGSTSSGGSINFWHQHPGAEACDGPAEDVCPLIGGWTYRRDDNTAIALTGMAEILTREEAVALLTDPAWAPYLDRIKQEPPT